ncbi:MAG: AAA family ATPase [Prevotella sp.]|nr:AAA family ATPase [Candidatus Prevotella equi]
MTQNEISTMLDAVLAKPAETAVVNGAVCSEELEAKLKNCIVSMNEEYPANKFLFSVDDVPVITMADLHTIGAKQKGGKTSLIQVFLAAAASGQWHHVKCLVSNLSVLYVDTEMKKVDTQQLGAKVSVMAGMDVLPENIHLVNFRPLSANEMVMGIRYFAQLYQADIIIVDGIVDLCYDFNDVKASQELVIGFLMKFAEEQQCAIINVLHTNKTDGYTELRGHLGAFFEQKGSTVIKCEKDDDNNIVTVKFPTHRYAPVPEFHFTFDENGIPVCADEMYQNIQMEKQRSAEQIRAEEKRKVYEERKAMVLDVIKAHGGKVERKALLEEMMARLNKRKSTVSNLLKALKADDVVTEDNSLISIVEQ